MVAKVQICDALTNNTYSDLAGVLEFTVTRTGYSQPGTLSLMVTPALQKDGSPAQGRFYPFLGIKVIEINPAIQGDLSHATARQYFLGRIDQAKLVDTPDHGRVWQIECRDWLAVLADNYVGPGKWISAGAARGTPSSVVASTEYVPNYVGDYLQAGGASGERRALIISDLCLNIIASTLTGLTDYSFTNAPNSKPIEMNWDNNAQICILDAIRDLARSDPWCETCTGGGQVDGKMLSDQGFPAGSGFGGELQVQCEFDGDSGRVAEYFSRDFISSGVRLVYGDNTRDVTYTGYIKEYEFNREGTDIFSRTRTLGKSEAQYRKQTTSGGIGVSIDKMETTWDPANGLFRVRRETPNRSEGTVGDWSYEDAATETDAIKARGLRDASYANLVSGAPGLSSDRGGFNQGKVTTQGGPHSAVGVVHPGTKISLDIAPLGIANVAGQNNFTVQSWSYSYPSELTTYVVSRQSYSALGEQLLGQLRRGNDSQSTLNDFYDTGWLLSDPSGALSIRHLLGVKPSKVTVEAASWDKTTKDPDKVHPLPTAKSQVSVPPASWDSAQGQNVGFFISKLDSEECKITFAHWLAYSDGMGAWLVHDDGGTIVRVRLQP